MARYEVTVATAEVNNLLLPDGHLYATDDVAILTEEQFSRLVPDALELLSVSVLPDPTEVVTE